MVLKMSGIDAGTWPGDSFIVRLTAVDFSAAVLL
jgi:hypothetical protein